MPKHLKEKNMKVQVEMIRTDIGQDETEQGQALPQKRYLKGEKYMIGQSLACAFVEAGSAKACEAEAEKPARKVKAKAGAPENKGE